MSHSPEALQRRLLLSNTALAAVAGILLASLLFVLGRRPETSAQVVMSGLSDRERQEYYEEFAQLMPGIWDAIPEPGVGRMLQPGVDKPYKRARVVANRARLRSSREYVPKRPGYFRIVCLGDSMTMGTAGREEDRWSDQIEEILHSAGVRVDGKPVEVYALAVGGWTALNGVKYLASRISEYRPDIVLALMMYNDLADDPGILGTGLITREYSGGCRQLGSGIVLEEWPERFGMRGRNLLAHGMGPESRGRYERTMRGWKRLEELTEAIGGRLVLGVARGRLEFSEHIKALYHEVGLHSPFLIARTFGERLEHDPHPNRAGHGILATHYLHMLAQEGYLPIERAALPPLHEGLELDPVPVADLDLIDRLQQRGALTHLSEAIDFGAPDHGFAYAVLGGLYPTTNSLDTGGVHGSTRAVFLLKRRPGARELVLDLEVPARHELFPFALELTVDGQSVARLALASIAEAGQHELRGPLPAPFNPHALEVCLRTDNYWVGIVEQRMRSYALHRARQE